MSSRTWAFWIYVFCFLLSYIICELDIFTHLFSLCLRFYPLKILYVIYISWPGSCHRMSSRHTCRSARRTESSSLGIDSRRRAAAAVGVSPHILTLKHHASFWWGQVRRPPKSGGRRHSDRPMRWSKARSILHRRRGHSPRVKLRRHNQRCSPMTFAAALGSVPAENWFRTWAAGRTII